MPSRLRGLLPSRYLPRRVRRVGRKLLDIGRARPTSRPEASSVKTRRRAAQPKLTEGKKPAPVIPAGSRLVEMLARGEPLPHAVEAEVRQLLATGKRDLATSLAVSFQTRSDTQSLGQLAGGLVAAAGYFPDLAWFQLRQLPASLWVHHAVEEYVYSGLQKEPRDVLAQLRALVDDQAMDVPARAWLHMLGPVFGFGDHELARQLARRSDVAVVVVGEWQNMIGESASRSSLELPGRQLELLQAVTLSRTPVVLLVMNGRPIDLRWAAANLPAILDVWYPGSQGGAAIANVLVGDVAPGGKLPFSWPRTVGQVPMIYSHTISHDPEKQGRRYWDEESTPLFPFGYGLSYGEIVYGQLDLDRSSVTADESLTVSVEVKNQGPAAAEEVVQLYVHQRHGSASRPVRELKGFERISLDAGEARTVRFSLGRRNCGIGTPRLVTGFRMQPRST